MVSNKEFDKRYKNLNAEQKKAVDTIDGPVLVIAGPGTGKTTILTLRIAQILRKTDTPTHGILAITYTEAGVKAMRQKLRDIIGNQAHDVHIHTFHGFASAMMAEYPDHFIVAGDFKQMTDVEQESIIRSIITDSSFTSLRPLGRPDAYIGSIIRAISDSKKEALIPEMVRQYAKTEIKGIKNDESNLSTRGATKGKLKAEVLERLEKLDKTLLFADVYEEYENKKQLAKLRDYDDLIIEFLIALRTDRLFLRLIQERFLYILVDEHQDTNDAQNYIVGLIAEFFETPNIFIVGDEKQAIYRFQGASVDNFLQLQKRWPSMKIIALDTNYRSHQSILDASFAMIENNYQEGQYVDLRVKLKSDSDKNKRPLDVIIGENTSAIEKYLVNQLREITKKESTATIAIITRRNRELERILAVLESHSIVVSSERSLDIFHHPIGATFFDLIEYLADPSRIDSLAKTLAVGMWGLTFGKAVEVIRLLKSGQISSLDKYLPALSVIQRKILKDGAVGGIIFSAEQSGFTGLVSRDPTFIHVWKAIVALAQSLVRDGDIESPVELMKTMLAYRQSAESKTVKVSIGAPDLPIKAMTAHGSKGLEFDYVFIPYTNEETWIGRTHGTPFILPEKNLKDNNVQDIRRLFYVAITRARKHAVILSSLEESDGKVLTPLRFLNELHQEHILTTSLSREGALVENNRKNDSAENDYNELMINEAKGVLLDSGLSVTALNHFMECPNKFLYESILKLPQAPSVTAEKGSAMHEALSQIWKQKKQSPKDIEKTIIDGVTEYIDKSFLSLEDKNILKKELIDDAPVVSKALISHFKTEGTVLTERWVKFLFGTSYQKQNIIIPIHGKLDVVVDIGNEVSVFDYKTRQAMSIRAIKGETKNDDGNYFRQLVFYKLLLQNNFPWRIKKISTSLVFISPDDKERCPIITLPVEEEDIKKLKQEIQSVIDDVWSGKIATKYCSERECRYCGYKRLLQKSV